MAGKAKTSALGKGLEALFGDMEELSSEAELQNLPIEKVEPKKDQPRTYFDEDALKELSESIEQHGILQPITVRKFDSGYYQIIAGERRWRASKMAGLTEIPAKVIDVDDATAAQLSLVENLQREDLNPIEEAKGYKTLADTYHLTQDDIAKGIKKSRSAVANTMRLLNLSEPVLNLVEIGKLSAGHARALLSLTNADQQLNVANEIIEKDLSARSTERLVAKILKTNANQEEDTPPSEIDYAKEISAQLTKLFGRKVTLTDGKKTGKIELEFYGSDDREALISQLKIINNYRR